MQLNEKYADLLVSAARVYGAQQSTQCSIEEFVFEEELFSLFKSTHNRGVSLQDIVVIASTAIAAILTEPKIINHSNANTGLVKPEGTKQARLPLRKKPPS